MVRPISRLLTWAAGGAALLLVPSSGLAQLATDAKIGAPDVTISLRNASSADGNAVEIEGSYDGGDIVIKRWHVSMKTIDHETLAGEITFPDAAPGAPTLSLIGTIDGSIVVFSIGLANGPEVATFAGNLAGTSLVGTFSSIDGRRGTWDGFWMADNAETLKDSSGGIPKTR